jgi:hypothetical protein
MGDLGGSGMKGEISLSNSDSICFVVGATSLLSFGPLSWTLAPKSSMKHPVGNLLR